MISIPDAAEFAKQAHQGQIDDGGQPHFVHCEQVARILQQVTNDPEIIAAGYLHDTLEDTYICFDDLVDEFGDRIARLVQEVTETEPNVFANLQTNEAVMIKFADRLSNLSRMQPWSDKRQVKYINHSRFWRG